MLSTWCYRLTQLHLENGLNASTEEKDLEILVNHKPNLKQQHGAAAKKANTILGCINRGVLTRWRKLIVALYSVMVRPHTVIVSDSGHPRFRKVETNWNRSVWKRILFSPVVAALNVELSKQLFLDYISHFLFFPETVWGIQVAVIWKSQISKVQIKSQKN